MGSPDAAGLRFLGLDPADSDPDRSKAVILPVPYEGTTTFGRGTANGPQAILEASQQVELFDEELRQETFRIGIHTLAPVDVRGRPEEIPPRVAERAAEWIRRGKLVVTLGGEHTASVGSAWAYREAFPHMTVLQIDAHADLRPEYGGSRFSHACAAGRMCEYRHPLTQVGIRNYSADEVPYVNVPPTRTFLAHEIRRDPRWIEKVMRTLSDEVYVTIDVDGFDPSVFPGTGTPEPGGLSWYDGLDLLRTVALGRRIVGLDVVEVAPIPGQQATEFAAAKLVYRALGYVFHRPGRGE